MTRLLKGRFPILDADFDRVPEPIEEAA